MDWLEKQIRLREIALKDDVYWIWRNSARSSEKAFREYVNKQPKEIRNMLWQYTESNRRLQQQLVNLACKYMDFPDE